MFRNRTHVYAHLAESDFAPPSAPLSPTRPHDMSPIWARSLALPPCPLPRAVAAAPRSRARGPSAPHDRGDGDGWRGVRTLRRAQPGLLDHAFVSLGEHRLPFRDRLDAS